jgi:hypothetical protein
MNTLISYTLNRNTYYLTVDVKKILPLVFTGCKRDRELIKRKRLSLKSDYVYARQNKNSDDWTLSDGSSKKFDKLFLSKQFVEKEYDTKLPDIYQVDMFDDACTFFGDELEVWGERSMDKCFFRVANVAEVLEIPDLRHTIIGNRSGYILDYDFYFFNRKKWGSPPQKDNKKELYLSYAGLVRVLYVSRHKMQQKFKTWVLETLYTHQIGTTKQKTVLAAKLLGTTYDAVKSVLSKSTDMPCIYLIRIGIVNDIFDMVCGVKKTYVIMKVGLTKSLSRRMYEHDRNYKKEFGVAPTLEYYSYIDPQYVSNAEADIKAYVAESNMLLPYDNYTELIIIKPSQMKTLKAKYNKIGKRYMGHITDMMSRLNDAERDMIIANERYERKIELLVSKHANEILAKDLEMANMKIEMLLLKSGQQ